jgi:hypothetical protein
MSDPAENMATRLWRDRAQVREQERNEALTRARLAEEKVVSLAAESARHCSQNDRLAAEIARLCEENEKLKAEIARLRTFGTAENSRTETEQQMEDLKDALQSLLGQPAGNSLSEGGFGAMHRANHDGAAIRT